MEKDRERTLEDILTKIEELEKRLINPPTYPTEVYSRITGYYRPLRGWNPGKAEEYRTRQPYSLKTAQAGNQPSSEEMTLLTSPRCPWCDKVKAFLADQANRPAPRVKTLCVDTLEGEELARSLAITAVPALVIGKGRVLIGGPEVLKYLKAIFESD